MTIYNMAINARMNGRLRGLTLIEVMVAIGIVVVLMGLVMGPLLQGRQRAQLATCTSNLKQIYQALQMYDQDHGALPPDFTVLETNYAKSRSIFLCPAYSGAFLQNGHSMYGNQEHPGDVKYGVFWDADRVPVATSTPGATNYSYACSEGFPLYRFDPEFIFAQDGRHGISRRHHGGVNNLWIDGHVKWTPKRFEIKDAKSYFYETSPGRNIYYAYSD